MMRQATFRGAEQHQIELRCQTLKTLRLFSGSGGRDLSTKSVHASRHFVRTQTYNVTQRENSDTTRNESQDPIATYLRTVAPLLRLQEETTEVQSEPILKIKRCQRNECFLEHC